MVCIILNYGIESAQQPWFKMKCPNHHVTSFSIFCVLLHWVCIDERTVLFLENSWMSYLFGCLGLVAWRFYKLMKHLGEQLQQVELKDGKNMLIRNKNPKILLVLLFAHQAILQILITWVHFHVFIAPIPQAPQHGQYVVSLLSAITGCQLPPENFVFPYSKSRCQRTLKPPSLHNFPLVWWISTLFALWLLWIQSTQAETLKMDPTRKNLRDPVKERWFPGSPVGKDRESWGWEGIVTEHVGKGRYGNLKF